MIETEVAILGGGIAGASLAAHVSSERSVIVLEREDQPGYHASGRSAALFSEAYGNAVVRGLSVASRPFLEAPPAGFAEYPLLSPRGVLHVGAEGEEARLERTLAECSRLVPSVRRVTPDEARALVPVLRPDRVRAAMLEPDARDIDTNALLSGFLRLARGRGAQILTRAELTRVERAAEGWRLETRAGPVRAQILVNAAGAWADEVASLAGLPRLGLIPKRRTAFLFEPPPGLPIADWPLVVGANEDFYFKPDAGMILGSPADETPSAPTDAQPEDLDVALAVDRIQRAADLPVRRIARRWAGLRTFAPDKSPVVGFDPSTEGFFWLAGQGGYGFQTAPALGWAAAGLLLNGAVPSALEDMGIAAAALAPERFRTGSANPSVWLCPAPPSELGPSGARATKRPGPRLP